MDQPFYGKKMRKTRKDKGISRPPNAHALKVRAVYPQVKAENPTSSNRVVFGKASKRAAGKGLHLSRGGYY